MTTVGILEVRKGNQSVLIYGRHDGYPDKWPLIAITWLFVNGYRDVDDAVDDVLNILLEWDFRLHKKINDPIDPSEDFYILIDPPRVWTYWYTVDLDTNKITVQYPVYCKEVEPHRYKCEEKPEIYKEFEGDLKEYMFKYVTLL